MSLREKLRGLQAESEQGDGAATIAEWRHAVDDLYRKVRSYLSEYEKDGLIAAEITDVTRSEPSLGDYEIAMLTLHMGPRAVVFSPAARYGIGADGRVDMYVQGSSSSRVTLRWMASARPEPAWAISIERWAAPPRGRTSRPLRKATLEEALDALLG